MDIGKSVATGGQDPASIYGHRADADKAGATRAECGECQTQKPGPEGTAVSPMVDISPEALARAEWQEALQLAKEIYDQLPDTRQDVISRVKRKLDEGYYESQDVQTALTEKLASLVRRLEVASR